MFFEDKKGTYRLEAVTAVVPLQLFNHRGGDGRAAMLATPERVVGVLHFTGGSAVQTDTDYRTLADAVRTDVYGAQPRQSTQEGA